MFSYSPLGGLACGNTNDKPILYHIEQCSDSDCYWHNRASLLGMSAPPYLNYLTDNTRDAPIGGYINIERLSSYTKTNRMLFPRNSERTLTISDLRNHRFSFSSLNPSSHIPLVHVSKIRMNDREGTIGNPFIKPPTREEDEEQIHVSNHELKTTNIERVSCIKYTKKRNISADILLNEIGTNGTTARNRDNVQVTRVRSSSLNVLYQPSLNESTLPKLDVTTIYLDDREKSKYNSNDLELYRMSTKSEPSSQINQIEITPDTLQPNPAVTSANSHIRVDRVSTRKARTSASLSSIVGMIRKKKTNHCNVTRVKRIPRKNTT